MRIKHFVVTYNNNAILEKCVESIFASATEHERWVYVIGNHSLDRVAPRERLTLMRNELRPDFSTGHLSRNWNQALINGFIDLAKPDADIVIACQNDCEFAPNYLDHLLSMHEKYDLITFGYGDNCVSYTPRAVRRVGLWDERFCNIGFQESDYFLRAAKFLGDRASINDGDLHGRSHNPVDTGTVVKRVLPGYARREESHIASMVYHQQSRGMFRAKWGAEPEKWQPGYLEIEQKIPNIILYPYFEKNVETLEEQKYMRFA